jgi:hypothetical protein
MSKHDEVLRRAETFHPDVFGGALIADLVKALREEIVAHDKTRSARNGATACVSKLQENVRGLELKVQLLQKELNDLTGIVDVKAVRRYNDGRIAGLAEARAAIDELIEEWRVIPRETG